MEVQRRPGGGPAEVWWRLCSSLAEVCRRPGGSPAEVLWRLGDGSAEAWQRPGGDSAASWQRPGRGSSKACSGCGGSSGGTGGMQQGLGLKRVAQIQMVVELFAHKMEKCLVYPCTHISSVVPG